MARVRNQLLRTDEVKDNPTAALAQIANTAARPGPLTTEWWTVLIAGAISSILAVVGLPGSASAQVAGIVAPIAIALVYAFVRAHTKGALADALKAILPQAATTVGDDRIAGASVGTNGPPTGVQAASTIWLERNSHRARAIYRDRGWLHTSSALRRADVAAAPKCQSSGELMRITVPKRLAIGAQRRLPALPDRRLTLQPPHLHRPGATPAIQPQVA